MSRTAGLTDPYVGGVPASYVHAFGHTFRLVEGDSYIAVMRGTCMDGRRVYVIKDYVAGQVVLESPQPVIDTIPVTGNEGHEYRQLQATVGRWARQHLVVQSGSGGEAGLTSR
jgi:hypothetical protein